MPIPPLFNDRRPGAPPVPLPGQLHAGVRGAHPAYGGAPTPEHVLAQDDHLWPDRSVGFVDTPSGQLSMVAGDNSFPTIPYKPNVDTVPHVKRGPINQLTAPLSTTDPAMQPTDPALHMVQRVNPNINGYTFEHWGDDNWGHTVNAYGPPDATGRPTHAGTLSWEGKNPAAYEDTEEEHQPGEVSIVRVSEEHRGRGLATAMWDYAHAVAPAKGISQLPVHSSNRSTAGNHWAHFVGGASLPRTQGQDVAEY